MTPPAAEVIEERRDPLALPSPDVLRDIAAKQDARAQEISERRKRSRPGPEEEERDQAAQLIQKNYRGYRARRELHGFGLDPGTRWIELLKDGELTTGRRTHWEEHRV